MGQNDETIPPREARKTRVQRAVETEYTRRSEAVADLSPMAAFWAGTVRNGVGIAMIVWAALRVDEALALAAKSDYRLAGVDLLRFGVPLLAGAMGTACCAPGPTFTFMRLLGLGGIVDRLPFIRRAEGSSPTLE